MHVKENAPTLAALESIVSRFLLAHPDGCCLGLRGELGTGKTTFVRMVVHKIAEAQGIPTLRVTSPSFVIHQSYPELSKRVEHFDFYRLEKVGPEELAQFGYDDYVDSAKKNRGFVFVEWPERASNIKWLRLDGSARFHLGDMGERVVEF